MKQDEDGRYTDRRPSSENKSFADGDFAKLVRKALSTVDLIFRNGLDWKALAMSMERFRVESEGIELAIQAIENKGEGDFVIRVDAPIDANKAEIEKFLKREYKLARNALESKYKSQLESKDRELDSTRQHNTNLTEIVKLMAARPITIENKNIGASTFMTDSSSKVNQTFQGPIYGVAGNVEGNQNIYTPEQKQNLAEAAAEIQQLLEQLSATYPTTTITEKSVIATKAIEALEKNPAQKAKIIKAVKAGGIAALKELVEPVMKPITNILFPILEALSEE